VLLSKKKQDNPLLGLFKQKIKQAFTNIVLPKYIEEPLYSQKILSLLDFIQRASKNIWLVTQSPQYLPYQWKIYFAQLRENLPYKYAVVVFVKNNNMTIPLVRISFTKKLSKALDTLRMNVSSIKDDIEEYVSDQADETALKRVEKIMQTPEYQQALSILAGLLGVEPEKLKDPINYSLKHSLAEELAKEYRVKMQNDIEQYRALEEKLVDIKDKAEQEEEIINEMKQQGKTVKPKIFVENIASELGFTRIERFM